ncbi:fimbrial biogenesis chaperone [Lonsdalea quercina]|uniref:fimbrial biogenesis chaperone n=1 Tax=Lonsdalea quercina TaxID=71657 RepID=UPI0039771753
MKCSIGCIGGACLLSASLVCHADGLTLGGTRLIYDAAKKEASLSLSNAGQSTPYLVQVWVSDMQRKTKNIPFIATPPLFKQALNGESAIRVVYTALPALPEDRESVYLLNVRAIPAVEKKTDPKRLTIATQNIIKLIYRPKGLSAKEAGLAWQKLKVTPVSGGISFNNPTPYVVTLTGMSVNGKKIDRPGTIMPRASKIVPVNEPAVRHVTYSTINDFGGMTTAKEVNF